MESNIRYYKKGDIIFKEGDFEVWMFALKKGTVGIYVRYGLPEETLLTEVWAGPASTFGEMGLLECIKRSATAVALEDVEVCVITPENFGKHFGNDSDALLSLMKNMSRRIRELTEDYLEACRAVAEAVEEEEKERSGWFKEKVNKFINDYVNAITDISDNGSIYYNLDRRRVK